MPTEAKSIQEIVRLIEEQKDGLEFLPTGFKGMDSFLDGGFLRKELIILGGFTGIGKSAIAGQLMMNIAKSGFKCAYFSLEISNEMIVSRMIGSISNIKPTRILTGKLFPDEVEKKVKAIAKLSIYQDNLYFYDQVYELQKMMEEIRTNQYEFVVIDFLQNVIGKGEEEYARLSNVALQLQKLAKETNSTIMVLSQLSNAVAREGDKSKVLEYKGSGSIATVCDLGFVIEKVERGDNFEIERIKIILRKNRRGSSGNYFGLTFRIPGGWIEEEEWKDEEKN